MLEAPGMVTFPTVCVEELCPRGRGTGCWATLSAVYKQENANPLKKEYVKRLLR